MLDAIYIPWGQSSKPWQPKRFVTTSSFASSVFWSFLFLLNRLTVALSPMSRWRRWWMRTTSRNIGSLRPNVDAAWATTSWWDSSLLMSKLVDSMFESCHEYQIHTKVWNYSSTRRPLRRLSSKLLRVAQSSVPLATTATGNRSPLRLSAIFNHFVVERKTLMSSSISMMRWRIFSLKGMVSRSIASWPTCSRSVLSSSLVVTRLMSATNRFSRYTLIFLARFSETFFLNFA